MTVHDAPEYALGIKDIVRITVGQNEKIKQIHLLAAAFNALQGGVFMLSGWDLVGALPVPTESVEGLIADNDHRWINRGGCDLLGAGDGAGFSIHGLPKAPSLYGDLETQLRDKGSFASRLKAMLSLRKPLGIAASELISVPEVARESVVILINELPEFDGKSRSWKITALNFGKSRVKEGVRYTGLAGDAKVMWSNLLGAVEEDVVFDNDVLTLHLQPLEAKLIVVNA